MKPFDCALRVVLASTALLSSCASSAATEAKHVRRIAELETECATLRERVAELETRLRSGREESGGAGLMCPGDPTLSQPHIDACILDVNLDLRRAVLNVG